MNLRRSLLVVSTVIAAALSLPAAASGKIDAPKTTMQSMTYEVYAGGIHAVEARLDIEDTPKKDRYHIELYAKTRGFLGKVAPWEGTFLTDGWRMKDGSKKPEMHKSEATWRGSPDVKEYSYTKDGGFQSLKITDEKGVTNKEAPDATLTKDTTDALTAALDVMKTVASVGKCEGKSDVFDGLRRFSLQFTNGQDVTLTPSSYNMYSGAAVECTVEVVPKGGNWHKKPRGWMSIQEQGRLKGSLPTVWFAAIEKDKPAVPVKVRVNTDYGTLFMHLVRYSSDTSPVKPASADAD
jgi:hypothetical protein